MNLPVVDVVVLTRDRGQVRPEVLRSLQQQRGVRSQLHRIVGSPLATDVGRWQTIARARNQAIACTQAPWVMFVDDDVELAEDCVARLQHGLSVRHDYGALAADYLNERQSAGRTPHVAMGATMFRRHVLERIRFRWEQDKCECLCCCEDLRRAGVRIDYMAGAGARHLPTRDKVEAAVAGCRNLQAVANSQCSPAAKVLGSPAAKVLGLPAAKVLAAFDRRDILRFRDVFLRSLRGSGNQEEVVVVGYGLYPSEQRMLASLPNVSYHHRIVNGQMAPVRRLSDFDQITSTFAANTPVAYWDASDVVFQGRLEPLWQLTQRYQDKLLAVREPNCYHTNSATMAWSLSISNPQKRRLAYRLFTTKPFLNSGFAAGSAGAMTKYFREAKRLRSSDDLRGTSDWGDQSALNLYCHSDAARWQEISESWNYCVHDRQRDEVQVTPGGRIVCRKETPIYVAHGNARSLAQFALIGD